MINAFGISVRIHPLFVFILMMSIFTGNFIEMFTLFGIVIIHELGHVWAARTIGWNVRAIKLLPFGGVAEMDQGDRSVRDELIVAIAGPLQHVWLIGLSFILEKLGIWSTEWSTYFIQANVMIALFNLIPVLPLDGGKMMQALLSLVLPYYRTMVACSWSSIVSSFIMTMCAFLPGSQGLQLNLFMIGCFLLYSNAYELRHLIYHHIRFLMYRQRNDLETSKRPAIPLIVHETVTLTEVVKQLYRGKNHLIYVVDNGGKIRSIIKERELIQLYFGSKNPK